VFYTAVEPDSRIPLFWHFLSSFFAFGCMYVTVEFFQSFQAKLLGYKNQLAERETCLKTAIRESSSTALYKTD